MGGVKTSPTVLLRRCIMNKLNTVDSKVLAILRECVNANMKLKENAEEIL